MREPGLGSGALDGVLRRYPFRATPYYLDLIRTPGPSDPVWLQCIPRLDECSADGAEEGLEEDPFSETGRPGVPPGVVHRFSDRVLLSVSSRCAMYCRHCTRKNTLHRSTPLNAERDWPAIRHYLVSNLQIREVLLSGGDPLLLSDDELAGWIERLRSIPSIESIRIGTRVPVVMPMRVTDALVDRLVRHRPVWVNTQFNHPCELTPRAIEACDRLVRAGLPVSNQSVLLRGVNDDVATMTALCRGLQRIGVRPYYVFVCDPVLGTAHLRVPASRAMVIERAVAARVGGLALPRFVADVPGAASKVPVRELG